MSCVTLLPFLLFLLLLFFLACKAFTFFFIKHFNDHIFIAQNVRFCYDIFVSISCTLTLLAPHFPLLSPYPHLFFFLNSCSSTLMPCFAVFVFLSRILNSPGFSSNSVCILELLIHLPANLKGWGCRIVPSCQAFMPHTHFHVHMHTHAHTYLRISISLLREGVFLVFSVLVQL